MASAIRENMMYEHEARRSDEANDKRVKWHHNVVRVPGILFLLPSSALCRESQGNTRVSHCILMLLFSLCINDSQHLYPSQRPHSFILLRSRIGFPPSIFKGIF